ncbi:MAG: lipid-A-disaccharide synthase [Prevotella sp.]|nr:lipid-A-disaccharide synthase [Prevotella sp.]
MKYYLIVGEASGDLHASHLMWALKEIDKEADFRFFGGDLMSDVGGTRVRHYRDLAYMGVIPVLLHLPTILKNMKFCKQDILTWQPDCVILIDYPGFNLKIAEYVKSRTNIPVYYYISPKIWAWKEYRIKNIRRDVDELFSILPFEVDFFEKKHHYPIHYVGNPTADEIREWKEESGMRNENTSTADISPSTFRFPHSTKKIIALLAGSRRQEIKDNLPTMIESVKPYMKDYRVVLAGAPGIDPAYYEPFLAEGGVEVVHGQTYDLLSKAHAALVTSGTATLETALFNVPQVVCYKLPLPKIARIVRRYLIKVPYISLVNLIADREVVTELLADTFTVSHIRHELDRILSGPDRERMLEGYAEVSRRLGDLKAPDNAARLMVGLLSARSNHQ